MINDKIYVCHYKRTQDNGKSKRIYYDMPIEYNHVVIAPVSGETDVAAYGERINKMFVASMNRTKASKFRENDRVYYGVTPPFNQNQEELPISDDMSNVSDENEQTLGEEETSPTTNETTEIEECLAEGANYKVVSVRPYNVKTRIYFELLP